MRVTYIGFWSSMDDLARKMQRGLDDSSLVVVKGVKLDESEYAKFLHRFGLPTPHYPGHQSVVLPIGDKDFETTNQWYDKKETFTLHFDGVQRIPERGHMPLTFLYGSEVHGVEGGQTFFHDLTDLYEWAMTDAILRKAPWAHIKGLYTHKTALKPTEINTLRFSPYSGRAYLLIDEWFVRALISPVPGIDGTGLLQRYRNGFYTTYRHHHVWEKDDLIVWSNESLVHGRTALDGGRRVLWRGIVWNNHRRRTT